MLTLVQKTPIQQSAPNLREKRILLVHLDSLFPKVMASQERVYRMAERLSRDHIVDVATTVRDELELEESRKHLHGVCNTFYPIIPINPMRNQIKRKIRRIEYYLYNRLRQYPHHYFYGGHPKIMAQLANIVKRNHYDVVQAEYWYMGKLFEFIDADIYKTIDTHDVLFDKKRQEIFHQYNDNPPVSKRQELAKYRELELKYLKLADLIISISMADKQTFDNLHLGNDNLLVPIGQDVEHFKNGALLNPQENVVLFYGSMGGQENIDAFFRLWRGIFPRIKQMVPDAKLLVLGANPPQSIKSLHNGQEVIVTGFVDDVRGYLSRAKVAVIPLNVAAGFRGRSVDVMAMEVPVVGTHRALDCVQIKNGVHGYIADSDAEMAHHAAQLLMNDTLRLQMGRECREFVMDKYSLDATIGKLSDYYLALA
ncbi:MAG: glycosyltransferase family 4 protein [Pseudomonadota bacterium]